MFFPFFRSAFTHYYINKLLRENFHRRKGEPIDIAQMFPDTKSGTRRILLLTERNELFGRAFFMNSLGADMIQHIPDDIRPDDVVVLFGYSSLMQHAIALYRSGIRNILFLEAGFLRSVLIRNTDQPGDQFDQSICFFVDDLGFHFDPTTPSRIEYMLNDPAFTLSPAEINRARALRDKIVSTKLTKYNDQADTITFPRSERKRVLVVEQARGDWAVKRSGGTVRSFDKMLKAAIDENPDCEILVKLHPDSINGRRGGIARSYYGHLKSDGKLTVIRDKVNPFTLIEISDKIYVYSSMLGFEAAMLGKEVHIFGKPCYAGWGVTRDRATLKHRTMRRSLDEVFYAIYFSYQKYKSIDGTWCEAEAAVDFLLNLRERYRNES